VAVHLVVALLRFATDKKSTMQWGVSVKYIRDKEIGGQECGRRDRERASRGDKELEKC
tara:strand:+ start:277 stop:450 length:174 start_codon:yes stop_codon:yes gene_type:complete